ncbi:MAG: hypothetical protein LBC64_07160 [Fibromonadaceae bacterium]|jgi:hypothetical protein|nr:hypothetical protein [Fibromonadaceae bacterium]
MIEASGQFPIDGKIDGKIETPIRYLLAGEHPQDGNGEYSQLNTSVSNSRAATQLDIERLKLIDDVSRLLLELKKQFPELAQSLSKAREYISVNQENIPIKNLMNLFSEIQQNLEALENKPAPAQKLELIDTIKNLVNEAIKILQPSSEIPSENKLIIALAQNDFASANSAIKNIVEQVAQRALHATPQLTQVQNSKIENFRIILNALQELKELGIPKELQKAPLKELEAIVLQRNGIEVPKEAVKNIPMTFSEKPVFATVSLKMDSANPTEPVRLQITPLPSEGQPRAVAPTFEIVLPKDFPLQKILANIPSLQPTAQQQIEGQTHRSAPTPQQSEGQPRGVAPTASQQSEGQPRGVASTAQQPIVPLQPLSQPLPQILSQSSPQQIEGQTHRSAPTPQQPEGQTHRSAPTPQQPEGQPRGVAPTAPQPIEGQTHRSAPTSQQIVPSQQLSQPLPQILPQPSPQQPEGQTHRSAPTAPQQPVPSQPLSQPLPQILPQSSPQQPVSPQPSPPPPPVEGQPRGVATTPPLPQKVELAFSLYQITPKSVSDIPQQTKIQPQTQSQFILQPWTASIALPKEERNFWLKTELPLTPQILNIREAILSSGKLPENPEIVKSFASNLHEMSLLTEHGTSVSKEQANLLWRVVQLNEQIDTPLKARTILHSPFSILHSSLLKYQPTGNYEGDLFKSLPEPVKRELSQELPAGKVWQPETLQKAVEKILEKYVEQQPANTANLNEHTNKAHEEIRNSLQNLKEQIQWTRIDQDTRPQNDRENIFYFMHSGELQKGRVKIRDERKGGSKKQHDSSISFTIKTKVKNLGEVNADLTLSKNILNIRMQDEVGTASNAIKEERETLARELADIGITLGEVLYGKTPKVQHLPVAKKEKSNSGFDVMA